jgi:nuclear GTP-binding protein
LLRQFSRLHSDKKQISVGFIGYPNTGKSSIINTLRAKKVCTVAPIPGETKVWQYITLMRRIYLIDCPGIVQPGATDSETDIVLKGVVRIENIKTPEDHIPAVLERVKKDYIVKTYGIEEWEDHIDFLTKFAHKTGKLHKGAEADLHTVSKMILNDWLRGNIPFYVPPPFSYEKDAATEGSSVKHAVPGVEQKLSKIRVEAAFDKEDMKDAHPEEVEPEADKNEVVDYDEVLENIETEVVDEIPDEDEPSTKKRRLVEPEVEEDEAEEADEISKEADSDISEDATEFNNQSGENSEEENEEPQKKERRMKTNKNKVGVHYYESANIKNKNKSRQAKAAAVRRNNPKLLEKKLKGDGKRRQK